MSFSISVPPKFRIAQDRLELAPCIDADEQFVFIVQGDASMRARLHELFAPRGYRAAAFATAAMYMRHPRPEAPACLVLGIDLPDVCGMDLQRQIAGTTHPPIVFVTVRGDVASSVRAMKEGAVDYLTEPLDRERLIEAAAEAIASDRDRRAERAARTRLEQRYSSLTRRERQVLPLIVSGLLNKQAGAELGISEVTLKRHRGKLMQKMEADSLADLVRMASRLNVPLSSVQRRGTGVAQRSSG
jgi:FixJ family two-component response regulator